MRGDKKSSWPAGGVMAMGGGRAFLPRARCRSRLKRIGSRCARCDACTAVGRMRRTAMRGTATTTQRRARSHGNKRYIATRAVFVWTCALLSSPVDHFYTVEASSNNGNGANAPFLVMSEITVSADDVGNHDGYDVLGGGNGQSENVDTSDAGVTDEDASTDISTNGNAGSTEHSSVGGSSSGSDTDGEDDDELEQNEAANNDQSDMTSQGQYVTPNNKKLPESTDSSALSLPESTPASAASQPLRTLQRLQAMLDDSDYATHTVASTSTLDRTGIIRDGVAGAEESTPREPNQVPKSSTPISNRSPPAPTERLWTSKDRARYRRTKRTERQRQQQQQREYEEQQARKMRDIQRQRIIREERERKELEDLRRKQAETRERQKYEQRESRFQGKNMQFDEAADFTDDETDTDGRGFELPNLPVYLSDGETEDFSEEGEDSRPIRNPIYSRPDPQEVYQRHRQNIGQNIGQPFQYSPEMLQNPQHQQHPTQASGHYQNYQQYPPYLQQQQQQHQQPQQQPQQPQTMQQYQYGQNHQQMQENQRQYEQQYAAWSQAAANGYYYPPPQPPNSLSFQNQQSQQPPQSSYVPQYPHYSTQQQPTQGASFATLSQQSYHTQQQNQDPGSAYSAITPQQMNAPIGRQAPETESVYQGRRGFFSHENDAQQQHQQNQQQQYARDESSRQALNNEADPAPPTNELNELDQMEVPEGSASKNVSLSTSVNGHNVQSAFVAPASPLISPIPSRVAAPLNAEGPYCEFLDESAVLMAGAESRISFDSIQKLSFSSIGVALLSYCAVSPRSLPFPEYNRLFLQNLSIVWLAAIAPLLSLLAVFDGKYNNINTAIGTFHVSFTLGYVLAFISEVVLTTAVRLGVFKIWEPAIFSLTPKVPSIILPWVLREKQYKPKRITLFAADFAASCVASPIIEEYLKLKIVQWTCKLPRNFKHTMKDRKGKRRRKQRALKPVRSLDAPQVTNINCYVTQMLAASLGLKLCDVTRRILMYTKAADDFKHIYAVCRGTFPIQELCGTMTALLLARRDVLGVNLQMWKILGPAVFIHGMANFRGMKPIFKWNSSTPWSEMQINQLKEGDAVWRQLLPKTYSKLVWMTILCRVFGFCVKNYYLIGRQAVKRSTTYSGKLHAFNAKLRTDSILKKTKRE